MTMPARRAASIIETLVVTAIIGVMTAMLLPAVQSARQAAVELQCKNHLHQINLALAQYAQTAKHLPAPGVNGFVGGWTIDILPFLEQGNLRNHVTSGPPISLADELLLRQPTILQCPARAVQAGSSTTTMDLSDYVLVPAGGRQSYLVFDAPLQVQVPWASGPEMTYTDVVGQTGPHHRGYFFAAGFQSGVNFIVDGQIVQ